MPAGGRLLLHQGDRLDDRWVVVRPFDLAWGRGAVVRDELWNGAAMAMITAPDDREGFERAAEGWRGLDPHRNVVAGYYTLEVAGRCCFFAAHPGGPRLETVFAERWRPIEERDATLLTVQIAAGLAHIHAGGLVHGHLEPAACAVGDRSRIRLTRLHLGGGPVGAAYRAPELWDGGPPSQAADVYALGVILYEVLAGRRPFDVTARVRERWAAVAKRHTGLAAVGRWLRGHHRTRVSFPPPLAEALGASSLDPQTETALLRHFHTQVVVPPPELDASLPFACRELVVACLSKDPAARPTAAEAAASLARLCDHRLPDLGADAIEAAANNRGVALAEMGRRDEAIEVFDRWLAGHPGAVHAWVNRVLLDLDADPASVHDLERRFDASVRPVHPGVDADPDVAAFLERLRLLSVEDEGRTTSVSVRPDGRSAAVAWDSGARVCLWDLADRRGTRMLHPAGDGPVRSAFLTAGGRLVVWAGRTLAAHESASLRSLWSRDLSSTPDALAVSPAGRVGVLAIGRVAECFNVASGEVLRRLPLPEASVTGLALDGSASLLAAVSGPHLDVIASEDGAVVQRLSVAGSPRAVAFVPGSTRIACAAGPRLTLFEARTGAVVAEHVHDGPITALAASPAGDVVATAGPGGAIRVWPAIDGIDVRDLPGMGSEVTDMAFTPDSARLIAGDAAGVARTWEVTPLRWPWLVRTGQASNGTPRPDVIARGSQERTLILQDADLASGIVLAPTSTRIDWTTSYGGPVTAVALSRAGDRVTVTERHSAHLSHIEGRRVHLDRQHFAHDAELLSVAFDADAKRIVAGTGHWRGRPAPALPGPAAQVSGRGAAAGLAHTLREGPLTIGRSPECGLVLQDPSSSRHHCTIERTGDHFVVRDAGSANGIRVNGTEVRHAMLRDGDVIEVGATELVFHLGPAGGSLASTAPAPWRRDDDAPDTPSAATQTAEQATASPGTGPRRGCVALVWEGATAATVCTLAGHDGPIRDVAFTRDGASVLTASDDGTARLWDAATGALLRTLPDPPDAPLTAVAVSPEDRWIALGRADGQAGLWDLATGTLLRAFEGHRLAISSVCFSGDGRLVATGSRDGTARLWRCWTGRAEVVCEGHTGPVTAVAFSPDDRLLLTGSLDGTARLWNRWDGQALHRIELREGVTAIDFSGDGRLLVTGGEDGTVQAWLMKSIWIYLDDLVTITEDVVDDPRQGVAIWPNAHRGNLDFWLDVWRDLRRCAAVEVSPELHARTLRARTRLLYRIVEWLRENGFAPELALGPKNGPPLDGDPAFDSPLRAIAQADPELVALLRMHLS